MLTDLFKEALTDAKANEELMDLGRQIVDKVITRAMAVMAEAAGRDITPGERAQVVQTAALLQQLKQVGQKIDALEQKCKMLAAKADLLEKKNRMITELLQAQVVAQAEGKTLNFRDVQVGGDSAAIAALPAYMRDAARQVYWSNNLAEYFNWYAKLASLSSPPYLWSIGITNQKMVTIRIMTPESKPLLEVAGASDFAVAMALSFKDIAGTEDMPQIATEAREWDDPFENGVIKGLLRHGSAAFLLTWLFDVARRDMEPLNFVANYPAQGNYSVNYKSQVYTANSAHDALVAGVRGIAAAHYLGTEAKV